jgi:hypothetical protein
MGGRVPALGDPPDGPPRATPEVLARARDAQARASELSDALPRRFRPEERTVATDGITVMNGQATRQPPGFDGRTAGLTDGAGMVGHTRDIGEPTPGHFADRNVPGEINASHAERIVARQHTADAQGGGGEPSTRPIGVSRDTCGSCRSWLRAHARSTGTTHVVADPSFTRVFHGDGTVDVHNPDGSHVRRVSRDDASPPAATRYVYQGIDW